MAATVTSLYQPRSQFLDFHSRSRRFAIMVCHRRMGKTVACINDLIDKAIQCPLTMPRYSYVAPFYKQAKTVAWDYLKHFAAPVMDGKPMESELSVRLLNGATVRLYGADNPDALRGVYHDGCIIDEYGDCAPRLFGKVIGPALEDRDGWCVFIGTPKGPNHFFELWEEVQYDDEWFTQMSPASLTGIFSAKKLEEIKRRPGSDEDVFLQEYECDFHAACKGAYYAKHLNVIEKQGHMGLFPHNPDLPVVTGWDIGVSDDTSIWFAQVYPDGKIHVIDFFTGSGYDVHDIVSQVLLTRPYNYGDFILPHDANNRSFQTKKSTREILWHDYGIKVRILPKLSLQDGIQAVRATIPMLYFNVGNEVLRREGLNALRLYQREWDDKNRMLKPAPRHDWSSHPADAMRYLCMGINPRSVAKQSKTIITQVPTDVKRAIIGQELNLDTLFKERERALRKSANGRI